MLRTCISVLLDALKHPACIKQSGSAAFSVTLMNVFTETCNGDFSFKKKHTRSKGTSEGHPVQPYVWSRTNFKGILGCIRLC